MLKDMGFLLQEDLKEKGFISASNLQDCLSQAAWVMYYAGRYTNEVDGLCEALRRILGVSVDLPSDWLEFTTVEGSYRVIPAPSDEMGSLT